RRRSRSPRVGWQHVERAAEARAKELLGGDFGSELLGDVGEERSCGESELVLELVLRVERRKREMQKSHEGLEHALARRRDGGKNGLFAATRELDELGVRPDAREIALVELDDERHLADLHPVRLEVLAQIE